MRPAFCLAILLAASCGNGGGGGDGGPDGDGSNGPPVCGVEEFIAVGTLNGSPVEERATVSGQHLVNVPGDTGCYVNVYFAGGGRLHDVTRHMLGLFAGRPGARAWRRMLSEGANEEGAGPELLDRALSRVPEAVRNAA